MKVKIRGIYSTALTKFLNDADFEIVNSSKRMNQRMNFEEDDNSDSTDVQIYDKEDLNGITINGNGAELVIEKMKEYFPDIAVKKVEAGAIYCGKIKKIVSGNKTLIVDIGDEEGILNLQNYWGFLREGEKVLAQVKGIVGKNKILSTQLRLFGNNMIIIKDGFTKVSKHIQSEKEVKRLLDIGKTSGIKGWGILWKSLSEGKSDNELVDEITAIAEEEKQLKEKFEQVQEPTLLKKGSCNYFVDFGASSKQMLDKIRDSVIPTIVGHHFLKSGGYSLLTDFAESLKGLDNDLVVSKMNSVLREEGPKEKQPYEIIHIKPGGKNIALRGVIEKANQEEIILKRRLKGGGRLDGIGGPIEHGDYSITTIKPNGWTVIHKYFSKEDTPKGVYVNINTPVEVYPKFARYLDLEIDVVEKDNQKEIIDSEKLQRVVDEGIIKQELAEEAIKIANKIVIGDIK